MGSCCSSRREYTPVLKESMRTTLNLHMQSLVQSVLSPDPVFEESGSFTESISSVVASKNIQPGPSPWNVFLSPEIREEESENSSGAEEELPTNQVEESPTTSPTKSDTGYSTVQTNSVALSLNQSFEENAQIEEQYKLKVGLHKRLNRITQQRDKNLLNRIKRKKEEEFLSPSPRSMKSFVS